MILRTPAPSKRPRQDTDDGDHNATLTPSHNNHNIVIYEDPPDSSPHHHPSSPSHHLCTYQCRQMVKADFFDALNKAETQVRDYQSQLESLSHNFQTADAERKKLRDSLLYTEQELAAVRGREQALQEQLLKEVHDSQERYKKHIHLHHELEIKLQNEMKLRKNAESLAASAAEKASILEGKISQLSESTEKDRKKLQNELGQLKRESNLSLSRIRADLERTEFRAVNAEREAEVLKEQLYGLRKQLDECLHEKGETEKKLLTLMSQELTSSDSSVLVKHLQAEIRNYEVEVREARKLKSLHENVEILKEKLLEARSHKERAESELLKLPEMQLAMKKLEDELSSWKLLINDIPGISCSEDVLIKFSALQKQMIENMNKAGDANARMKQLEVSLDAAELSKENAEIKAALAKEKLEVSKSEIKLTDSKLSMVTEERDHLRNIISDMKKQKDNELGQDSSKEYPIQELESCISNKESCIRELEISLQEQREANSRQHNEIGLLNEKLNNEARRIKSLERESDRLRSEISLLESKLGHGDYSATNTKVLRMVNTLAVDNEAKQTIEVLQTELHKTKEKLESFEELKRQSADAGKSVESYISGKLVQYKEQIATLEKREERYKTVFADRISVFRRACCELFGYKIVMDEHQRPNGIPVTHFTLQSIYAQHDDEKLEFEYESGNTNIVENGYILQPEISKQVEIFIRKLNSIPAFTANLTVESFNKRTLC